MISSKKIVPDKFLSEILKKECFKITGDISSIPVFKKNSFYTYAFNFDPKIMNLCRGKGFVYIGGRVDFKLQDREKIQETNAFAYSVVTDKKSLDLDNLFKIAQAIAKESRFYKDQVTKNYAFSIYEKWIKNSLMNNYADDFFLLQKDGVSIALITLKKEEKGMRIDLIGVSDIYQQRGIGTILINLVKYKYKKENIYVGAQAENVNALNFYYKNGFVAQSYKMIYRKET